MLNNSFLCCEIEALPEAEFKTASFCTLLSKNQLKDQNLSALQLGKPLGMICSYSLSGTEPYSWSGSKNNDAC